MRRSPLDSAHRRLGARFATFGGWDMPLSYEGTIQEHLACRSGVAVFDVSHLGTVRGRGAAFIEGIRSGFSNDLDRVAPGRAQYTLLLDDDASVLDDLIVWWHPDGSTLDVMPNASNTERVRAVTGGDDITDTRALLALQGPDASTVLASVLPGVAVGRFRVEVIDWNGVEVVVAGTGYTGEAGVEMAVPADAALQMWSTLLDAGAVPAGLGARDTLRLEAALPLHGHELGPGITPAQAGLERFVVTEGRNFPGRARHLTELREGPVRRLVGLATDGRRPPRRGCPVQIDGTVCGAVTSGNFSPTLGHGIALALLWPTVSVGEAVSIEVRGTLLDGVVVALPFVSA